MNHFCVVHDARRSTEKQLPGDKSELKLSTSAFPTLRKRPATEPGRSKEDSPLHGYIFAFIDKGSSAITAHSFAVENDPETSFRACQNT